MTVVGIYLVVVGLTDLLRGPADIGQPSGRARWPALGAGLAVMVLLALLLIVSDHARADAQRRGGLV